MLNSIIALQTLSIIDTIFTVACKKEGGEKDGREGREEIGNGAKGGGRVGGRREGRGEGIFTCVSYVSGMLSILWDGTFKNQPN